MSDEFDDFGDDFSGVNFAELDEQVSTLLPPASQQPRHAPPPTKRVTEKYHHTVSKPSKQVLPRSGLSKDPGPINTEPRAAGAGSGFGWNVDGGKRSYDGNLDRHLGDERRRNDEWRNRNGIEEEEFPEVVVRKEGGYGFGISEVAPPASQNTAKGAAARREAIINASRASSVELGNGNNAIAGLSRLPQQQQQQQFKPPQQITPPSNQFPPRALARSTSAGHQPPPPRPSSRNGVSNLATIHSQPQTPSNSQQPPSQGSLVRKTAFELAEEVRKRENAEAEIKALRAEVERVRLENVRPREETRMGGGVDQSGELKKLKEDLWKAVGEGTNMRRAQKDVSCIWTGLNGF